MNLFDFINKPCAVCDCINFDFFYCRKFKEVSLKLNNDILIGSFNSNDFSINLINNTIIRADHLPVRFRIMKECNKEHYRSSTNYITRYLEKIDISHKLNVPDDIMYEDIYIKFSEDMDSRVPEGGGSINFINEYHKNEAKIMTPSGWKKLPIVPLDRFNLKNPVDVLNKLESLMVLL